VVVVSPAVAQHGPAYPSDSNRGPAFPGSVSPTDTNPTNWIAPQRHEDESPYPPRFVALAARVAKISRIAINLACPAKSICRLHPPND